MSYRSSLFWSDASPAHRGDHGPRQIQQAGQPFRCTAQSRDQPCRWFFLQILLWPYSQFQLNSNIKKSLIFSSFFSTFSHKTFKILINKNFWNIGLFDELRVSWNPWNWIRFFLLSNSNLIFWRRVITF